ncbi:hypothetical protein B0H14DRAFT_2912535 [Mycena olivaceomarginata]|nr:hypothetical protein B0H14DRAFT_2912535 [Mycena olivaceomarginata]
MTVNCPRLICSVILGAMVTLSPQILMGTSRPMSQNRTLRGWMRIVVAGTYFIRIRCRAHSLPSILLELQRSLCLRAR